MMMNQSRRNAYAIIILVLTCCLVMVWVEGSLRPIYPVKSALKIAVFLGCTGLYALLTKDKGPFGAFRRSKAVKLAAPLALAVPVFLLGGYLLLSPWLDLSAIPANLAAKEGITAKTFPLAALYITFCNPAGGVFLPGVRLPCPVPPGVHKAGLRLLRPGLRPVSRVHYQ